MTPEESWSALVHSLTVEQFQLPKNRPHTKSNTAGIEKVLAEARRIAELFAEPPAVGERRRALLERDLVSRRGAA